jgi:hypothetical protein
MIGVPVPQQTVPPTNSNASSGTTTTNSGPAPTNLADAAAQTAQQNSVNAAANASTAPQAASPGANVGSSDGYASQSSSPNTAPGSNAQMPQQPQQQMPRGVPFMQGPQMPGFIVTLSNGQQIFVPQAMLMQQLAAMGIGMPAFHPGGDMSQEQYEQLLNQLFNAHRSQGPPPTSEAFLKSIPKAKIEQSHVDKKEECSICKDEFTLDQEVASLPCGHLYHEDCVVPWLKEHNTCPYCRHQLPAVSQEEQNRRHAEEEARRREQLHRERQQREAIERERRRQQQEAYNRQRQRMLAAQVLHTTRQNQLEREREQERQKRILESMVLATRMNQQQREARRAQRQQEQASSSSSSTASASSSPAAPSRTLSQSSPANSVSSPSSLSSSSQQSPSLSRSATFAASPAPSRGADAMDVDTPSTSASSPSRTGEHDRCSMSRILGDCVLCDENPAYVILSCGHEFHCECLDTHLRVSGEIRARQFRCPSCLRSVSRLEQMDVD